MTTVLTLEQIKKLINVPQMINEIETGFVLYSEGKVVVPPVGFLNFKQPPGDVHIKYGYVSEDDYYVLKMASGFYDNHKLGLPISDGLLLVFSQKTGELKMILLDKCWLTDMRTAAAGAVAAKHMAPKNISSIGIVGTGVQARMQLEMLNNVVDCNSCYIWGRDADKVQSMINDLHNSEIIQSWGLTIKAAKDMDELTDNCNLIVTTTSAREPLISVDQVRKGTHITAMGSDDHGKQELDARILQEADIVVADSVSQCVDHGECFHAVKNNMDEQTIIELGNLIINDQIGRTNDQQISVADLTGVAIQDIQIAKMVDNAYRNSR